MAMASASSITAPITLIVLSTSMISGALADAGFIARTCQSADNAQCVAVLSADPRSANATTVLELAGIALDIAVSNARDSAGIIDGMAGRYEGMPEEGALHFCGQVYADATDHLDGDARGSLGSGQYADASRVVSGAEDAGDECEKAFTDINVKSPVADVDQRMKDRCGLAGDLIDLLVAA